MQTPVTITHSPYGVEHPYETSAIERQPRDPVAGDQIVLGVQTEPADVVSRLDAVVRINGGAEKRIAATIVSNDNRATNWRVELPTLQASDHVQYFFQADSDATVTESFGFTVSAWQEAGAVRQWWCEPSGVRLAIEPGLLVTIRFIDSTQIQVGYATGEGEGELHTANAIDYTLVETDNELIITSPSVRVIIQRDPYRLVILSADGEMLFDESQAGGVRWLLRNTEVLQIATEWQSPPDESFMGFGERFNSFNQRGQQIDTLVYEEYKNQGRRTYLPVPFFISSRGYGIWLQTYDRAYFDLASDHPQMASFAVKANALNFTLFVGKPKDVLTAFHQRVGKAVLPPKWAFGLWMSSNEWNNQAQVMEQVGLTHHHAIPATVLVIEAWSDESTFYLFNDAQYAPRSGNHTFSLMDFTFPPEGKWPDPKGMVDALHEQGIRLLLWQIPVFKKLNEPHAQHDLDVAHVLEEKYVLQEGDGYPYRIRPLWFRDGFVPDFTNPELERWWFERRRYLIDDLGVDGFKTDGSEHIWGEDVRASDGNQGTALINLFPNAYEAAYARFTGSQRVLFSRAGYTGSQAFSTHWAGDENSTFAAFRASITAGLTAGVSGVTFWGWDIGGFGGGIPSAELYLRATAMATFCPIMQYHSEYNPERIECRDRTPWNVQAHTGNPDIIATFRYFANLRMNLLPHLWSEAIKASRSGLPLMRALALEFPTDPQVADFPYQYLLGENLLIAPVVWEACNEIDVYLPAGEWYDFWTGQRLVGGKVFRCSSPINQIPVFVRAGSILALNLPDSMMVGESVGNAIDQYKNLVFRTYPSTQHAIYRWFNDPLELPQIFEISPHTD